MTVQGIRKGERSLVGWSAGWIAMSVALLAGDLLASCQPPSGQDAASRSGAVTGQELEQLAWMVGDWTHADSSLTVRMNGRWSDDRHFLLLEFRMQAAGAEERTASERIAWDPVEQVIRSWTFRDDGSFAESVWTAEGEKWKADSSGVVPAGKTMRSVIRWEPTRQALLVRATRTRIGEDSLPDTELKLVRDGEDDRPMPDRKSPPAGAAAIENVHWEMFEMQGVPMEFDRPLSIKLVEGKLQAFGGVNRIGGSYTLDGPSLRFGALMATRMGGPPELMELEANFSRMLESVDNWTFDGAELQLLRGAETLGRFRSGR